MDAVDVHRILSSTIWTILIASGPVLTAALVTGLAIALMQALTSVQEMTLTFVPKVAVILVAVLATLPFIYAMLDDLGTQVFTLIVHDGF